jgi:hypothetical protein
MKRDEAKLSSYLDALARADLSTFSPAGKLAFWINTYNALAVRLILERYPVQDLRGLQPVWREMRGAVGGREVSLTDIEDTILSQEFREPRAHFAVVCGTRSSPELLNRAYAEDRVVDELDGAARRFMQSSQNVRVCEARDEFGWSQKFLYLSGVFELHRRDFMVGRRSLQDFVHKYADEKTRAFVQDAGTALSIRYLPYDWSLNEIRK